MSRVHSPSAHTQPGKSKTVADLLATSRRDVTVLAWMVEDVSEQDQARVAAHIIHNSLMIIRPWWWRILFWLIKTRRNALVGLVHFYNSQPSEARHLLTETARHIRHGVDREQASSVGGFSQREVNIMTAILKATPASSVGTKDEVRSEPNPTETGRMEP